MSDKQAYEGDLREAAQGVATADQLFQEARTRKAAADRRLRLLRSTFTELFGSEALQALEAREDFPHLTARPTKRRSAAKGSLPPSPLEKGQRIIMLRGNYTGTTGTVASLQIRSNGYSVASINLDTGHRTSVSLGSEGRGWKRV